MAPDFLTVSADDVRRLDDAQFKELLTRLIRAELIKFGLPISGLLAGGHQNAPDGGADIQVSWKGGPGKTEFLPRRNAEVQVKATPMPPAKMAPEMRHKGKPREFFADLAKKGGAYLIASTETCAARPLKLRKVAMSDALNGVAKADQIALDFFDAKRIALWVSRFGGIALWVKETLGGSHLGWRAWTSWSAEGRPGNLEFVFDNEPRAVFPPA